MDHVAAQPIDHDGRRYAPGEPLDFEPSAQLLASGSVSVVEKPEPEAKPSKPVKRGGK